MNKFNFEKDFTAYEIGWPGSVTDSTVFKQSDMWLRKELYFEEDEYILVDKGTFTHIYLVTILLTVLGIGYPLTKFSIRPFADNELTNDPAEAHQRKAWNRHLSRVRVAVENAFGRLKGRFPSLRNMPGHNIDEMYRTIEALLIVHNIVEEFGDDPTKISGFNGDEDPDVYEIFRPPPIRMDDDAFYRTGLLRRKHLLKYSIDQGFI